MLANFSKALANKLVHQPLKGARLRGPLLKTSPLDFPLAEDSIATKLMTSYRASRLSESFEYCLRLLEQTKPNSKFAGLINCRRNELDNPGESMASIIRHYQIPVDSLPLEAIGNLLFFIAKLKVNNDQLETALLKSLEKKPIVDFTETNLADLLFYFKETPAKAKTHKALLEAAIARAKDIEEQGLTPLDLNGSSVGLYQADPDAVYSWLEKGVIAFLNSKGALDNRLYLQHKFVLPAFNFLIVSLLLKRDGGSWLNELSPYNELQRLSAHMQAFK